MNKALPTTVYTQQIQGFQIKLKELVKKKNLLAGIRLAFTILAFIVAWQLHVYGWLYTLGSLVVWLAVFLRMVVVSTANNAAIHNYQLLIKVNETELAVARGEYLHLPDGSSTLLSPVHEYANDLDIFGRASLYQFTNRTMTQQGNAIFANWLLHPSPVHIIYERQEAARELAPSFEWRHQLQAYGIDTSITMNTQTTIKKWLLQPAQFINSSFYRIFRIIFPVITLSVLALHIAGVIRAPLFYLLVILFLAISGFISKKVHAQYVQLNKIMPQVDTLYKSLHWIEQPSFKSKLLQQIQKACNAGSTKASVEVNHLKKILDRFDYRLNPVVFLPLNTFFLWDLQVILQLEQWKIKNQQRAIDWFDHIGETEALCSLANLHFNHPEWPFPSFDEQAHGTYIAEALGHPLIPAHKMVSSSFQTKGVAQLALVTGSNMAGKSTFLRSVGVNMVLAMMGSPVCAKSLLLSPMKVMSSMRIADNLEESTSTFYAELKKLQQIIEAVNRGEKIFLLLDEILRGTNSLDRHTGSKALILQLIRHNATGILATHDVALATLVNDHPNNIHNYHFDVQIADGELYFDYKLKEGICQSLNASILMKKIGIEM